MAGDWQTFQFQDPTTDWERTFNTYQQQGPGMGYNYASARQPVGSFQFGGKTYQSFAPGNIGMEDLSRAMTAQGFDPNTLNHIRDLYGSSGGSAGNAARALGVDENQFGLNAGGVGAGQYTFQNGQLVNSAGQPVGPNVGSNAAPGTYSVGTVGGQGPAAQVGVGAPYGPASTGGGSQVGSMAPSGGYGAPIPTPTAANNYAFNPSAYLDPSMAFTMQQGLRSLGSQASAGGQTFSGNTLKDILGYSQGLASQNWNQAAQQAAQQQQFGRGIDVSNTQLGQSQQGINNALNEYNQNFDYQKQLNDQTIPFQQQLQLGQLGLQGTGQQSQLAQTLATLLSGNLNTLGQIQGAGTVGANNSITNAISQILASLNQNSVINRALPGG